MARLSYRYLSFLLVGWLFWVSSPSSLQAQAQVFELNIGEATANTGDTVCIPLRVRDAKNMVALQFSLAWDASSIQFNRIQNSVFPDLFHFSPEPGRLNFNWIDSQLDLNTLSDDTSLVEVCFVAIGDPGTHSDIYIQDDQTVSEVVIEIQASIIIPFISISGAIHIAQAPSDLDISADLAPINCDNGGIGAIYTQVSGGMPPYQADWTGPDGFSASSFHITDLYKEGNYYLRITDAAGDQRLATFQLFRSLPPVRFANTTVIHPSCDGSADGSINFAFFDGVTGPYEVLWSSGQTTPSIKNLRAGVYTISISDAGGCSYAETIFLEANGQLAARYEAQLTAPNCNLSNGQIRVTMAGPGPYEYAWSTGQDTAIIDNLNAGRYVVTITEPATGCSIVEHLILNDEAVAEDAISVAVDCSPLGNGAAIYAETADQVALKEFRWSTGVTNITTGADTLFNVPPGKYDLVVTDLSTNCQWYSDTIRVDCSNANDTPCSPFFYASNEEKSENIYMVISVQQLAPGLSGQLSLRWDPNRLYFQSAIPNPASAEALNLELSGNQYTEHGLFTFSFNYGELEEVSDFDTLFILELSANLGFNRVTDLVEFSDLPSHSILYEMSSLNPISWAAKHGTVYTIDGFDNGFRMKGLCLLDPSCDVDDGAIRLLHQNSPPDGFRFFWIGPDGYFQEGTLIENLAPGNYHLIAQNGQEGYYRARFTLSRQEPQIANATIHPVSCYGEPTGGIFTYPLGGAGAPYTFDWSDDNLDGLQNPQNLLAGTYTLTISDALGCSQTENFTVLQPDSLQIILEALTCANDLVNGSIDIHVEGGVLFYEYLWDNGETLQDIEDLSAGTYAVTVTDGQGCTQSESFILDQGIADISLDTLVCKAGERPLFVTAPNALSYQWHPANLLSCSDCPNPIATFTESTTFEVTVTENGGCEDFATIQIDVNDCVWPGDTDTNGIVNHYDLLNIGLGFGSMGPQRPNTSTTWLAQAGFDWPEFTPNSLVNYKHPDADGSGEIGLMDVEAINSNWGEERFLMGEDLDRGMLGLPWAASAIVPPFYVLPDTFYANEQVALPLILGTATHVAENIYGIAFSIHYDPSVIVPGSAILTFMPSWIGIVDENILTVQKDFHAEGRLDAAIVRTDGQDISGFGPIAILNITIEDDIFLLEELSGGRRAGQLDTYFSINGVLAINAREEQIEISTESTQSVILENVSGIGPALDKRVSIFPSPAHDYVQIRTEELLLEQIEMIDLTGRRIRQWTTNGHEKQLELQDLPAGIYTLAIHTNQGPVLKRLPIVH
ncbi:MAG: T9SS type A sorting domain-containing protein [Bacteroidota bacterium]